MGEHIANPAVDSYSDPERLRLFMKSLLNDVRALERMIEEDKFESGVRRIGAEQELCLIDSAWRPAPIADRVLEHLTDNKLFTSEIGRFNLEFNLDPMDFGGDVLSRLESDLNARLEEARVAARREDLEVLMTGILPTLRKTDLAFENMMPLPRYHALNAALSRLRGGEFDLRLTGTDELIIKHDSVMLESCNTSCQVHFQVSPEEFPRFYNIAQVVTPFVLAAAVNSPLLFGRRLWRETRIALFQQAVDTRPTGDHMLDRSARVSFGDDWVRDSVVEIFREDITRFRVVLGIDIEEDAMGVLEEGGIPKLRALSLHNGTVYRWNRPCYGIMNGRPTLRIENRALPAGPTVIDEVANSAFWFGLVSGMVERFDDIRDAFSFDDTRSNFLAASRLGLDAQLVWLDGKPLPARRVICEELLPIARSGLETAGIDGDDIARYLDVIDERVSSGRTGARWLVDSFQTMEDESDGAKMAEKMAALVAGTHSRQAEGKPVHEWDLAHLDEGGDWVHSYHRVDQVMSTDVLTVHVDEVIDLVANVMDWKHVRHVPVEDADGLLVGLVSYRSLLRLLGRDLPHGRESPLPVSEVMRRDVITITPETTTLEAIELMRREKVACLPVVTAGRLVGVVAERDFLRVASELMVTHLRRGETR